MARQVIPIIVDNTELLVEVDINTQSPAGSEQLSASPKDRIGYARESVVGAFDQASESILAVARRSVETLRRTAEAGSRPDELEVKFGLKFSAKGSVIVAEASGEANLEIKLTYRSAPELS
jgi:hypothetical protein